MTLQTPTEKAGRLFTRYAKLLEKLNIFTLEDLLFHVPFRYEDFSLISKIGQLQAGEKVTVQGTIVDIENTYSRYSKKLQRGAVADQTGEIPIVWFNQPYIPKVLKKGDKVSLSGKVGTFTNKLTLESPDYEVIIEGQPTLHTGRLVPIYPETRGVTSKWLRRRIYALLTEQQGQLTEYMPQEMLERHGLIPFVDALTRIHFPETLESAEEARTRLSFDELLQTHLRGLLRKAVWKRKLLSSGMRVQGFEKEIEKFWENLPFQLTYAQQRAVKEIFSDIAMERPMNRLLEGDVGSGKTVVAAAAMYVAKLNGFQSVLMAPTEILANQHYKTISDLLAPLNVNVELVTGSKKIGIKNKELGLPAGKAGIRKKNHNSSFIIPNSRFDILIGTHAVLSEKITLNNLGLVVIDEQQRFGVAQRSLIREKGKSPHVLSMTATPIPRTVALTLYGDLDLSVLDEMPKGRKIVKTWVVPEEKRDAAYDWIRKQIIEQKSQAFILCPFIEESETMQTVKAATIEFERLKKEVFPDLKLAMLHGKQKSKDKTETLTKFREGAWHMLVATPVVEVGIDIPNATIMLVEASERFGLAQLHQLRGRVGRGDKQSYCLLFTTSKNPQTVRRLKAMETTQIGAELAELDLKLRGPGEIYGTKQHGVPMLKIASFSDFPLIEKTKQEAQKLFPNLANYPRISEKLQVSEDKQISPD